MNEARIGFSGHQGLTAETATSVAKEIALRIGGVGAMVGICSLAEGSDQIFAEAVLGAGGELVVVIPCEGYEETFTDPVSLRTFRTLWSAARSTIQLDLPEPSEEAFWEAGKRVVGESDQLLAVWDGRAAGGLGGTADVVSYAREQAVPVTVIWPPGAARS